jgi:hypothetical protein
MKPSDRWKLFLVVTVLAFFSCESVAAGSDYALLAPLLEEFREFRKPRTNNSVPDFSAEAMAEKGKQIATFQQRLAEINPTGWPVSEQIDYHLVRAEMNGMEFYHRVVRPWARDPGFYLMTQSGAGPTGFRLRVESIPIPDEDIEAFQRQLKAVPQLFQQAKANLTDGAADFVTLALHFLGEEEELYRELAGALSEHHPALTEDAERAEAAVTDFGRWLEENRPRMTAPAGVGKDNYNWLLKNVYLFPYTWDEVRTIVELEDNRVITFQRLEENRNRHLPPLQPVQSQAEYKQSVQEALDHIMAFLREEEIFTMHDYLVPGDYFGSWHGFENPWPEKHDYFFNFSHRDPVMEETHEMVGHHFDGLRARNDIRPIRGGRRPYKITTARNEGLAFALEELLMHAGYLDTRSPRAREIAYEQAAFRTVRALSDVYMHSRDWDLEDALEFCVGNAPHGELLDGSHHLWYELATTLRGVGHHMLMVVGKVQFMKLFRDRANQLGDDFVLKEFMDEFYASGFIPMSLIRWEMTGYDDEVKKLWQPSGNASIVSSIELGVTNTWVKTDEQLLEEYDLRLSVETREDVAPVQSLTILTPTGTSFTVDRSDEFAMDQIDPEFGIEIIRAFELQENVGAWTFAAIASSEFDLFGDGTYTLTAHHEGGSEVVELWFGEPGSKELLPFPTNRGFSTPDLSQPLTNPITFTWEANPDADYAAVFMANGEEEKSDEFPATTTSFGPFDYAPGEWGFELSIGTRREGNVDGVRFSITKGTVWTTDQLVGGS